MHLEVCSSTIHEYVTILAVLQILANENTVVIAGARSPHSSEDLQELHELHSERLHLVPLDVASTSSIQVCAIQTLPAKQQNHTDLDQPPPPACLSQVCLLHTPLSSLSWLALVTPLLHDGLCRLQ